MMRITARWSIFLCLLLPARPAHAQAPVETGFAMRRRDALRVMVWQHPEFSGDFEIMTDGNLAHPLLKDIRAEGRTFEQVRSDVEAFLRQFEKSPQVIVLPLFRISVGGAVVRPGIVSVDPRADLTEVLGMVGGPLPNARVEEAYLVRTGAQYLVQLWGTPDSPRNLLDLGLQSGDQILFPQKKGIWQGFFVPLSAVTTTVLSIASFIYLISQP
jgi:polysaccharide biosynthesis/export protein